MNKLILDGVEYKLSDSLVAELKEVINSADRQWLSHFHRCAGEKYHFIDELGQTLTRIDVFDNVDEKMYEIANFCRDEELMKQRALHETLNRLLWRYSEMHGGDSNPWPRGDHWFIYCNTEHENKIDVGRNVSHKMLGAVYFSSYGVAVAAVEKVVKPFLAAHPEFKW